MIYRKVARSRVRRFRADLGWPDVQRDEGGRVDWQRCPEPWGINAAQAEMLC